MFREYGRFLVAMGLFYCVLFCFVSEIGPHFTPGWPQTFKILLLSLSSTRIAGMSHHDWPKDLNDRHMTHCVTPQQTTTDSFLLRLPII